MRTTPSARPELEVLRHLELRGRIIDEATLLQAQRHLYEQRTQLATARIKAKAVEDELASLQVAQDSRPRNGVSGAPTSGLAGSPGNGADEQIQIQAIRGVLRFLTSEPGRAADGWIAWKQSVQAVHPALEALEIIRRAEHLRDQLR